MTSPLSLLPQVTLIEENIKVCRGCHVQSILIEGWERPCADQEDSPILKEDFDVNKYSFTEDVIRHYFARHRWGLEYKASLMVEHQSNSLYCYNYELEKVYQIIERYNFQ